MSLTMHSVRSTGVSGSVEVVCVPTGRHNTNAIPQFGAPPAVLLAGHQNQKGTFPAWGMVLQGKTFVYGVHPSEQTDSATGVSDCWSGLPHDHHEQTVEFTVEYPLHSVTVRAHACGPFDVVRCPHSSLCCGRTSVARLLSEYTTQHACTRIELGVISFNPLPACGEIARFGTYADCMPAKSRKHTVDVIFAIDTLRCCRAMWMVTQNGHQMA